MFFSYLTLLTIFYTFRCDKIQGDTIPINHARPNRNIAITRREPIGVCGLVTPWNYPLMMLSWKMAACLAAGNTVVIKPANVCPLTALKFAGIIRHAKEDFKMRKIVQFGRRPIDFLSGKN